MNKKFDAIVVGAGHAGVESAMALARLGKNTCLITLSLEAISFMACNPNVGGTAKGHLVCEISALGGVMGKVADKATIQSRMLNLSNGPAVHSLRAQVDKNLFHRLMKHELEAQPLITLLESEVKEVLTKDKQVIGVKTVLGQTILAKAVVLATGVYLKSKILIGDKVREGGPSCFAGANSLTANLLALNLPIRRFKTGTPPRINGNTVDYEKMEVQQGDKEPSFFSYETQDIVNDAKCYLTYTNEKTHQIIIDNLDKAPMFNGLIEGVGPRYCPSIESKIVRFADKDRHQIFVEPEGADTDEVYLQGLSTSMPWQVQEQMVHSIVGLEKAKITRYGYAIEYDAINPLALYPTLEIKGIKNLFSAGQLNGSSGYEEAAAQGLVAGLNASRAIDNKEGVVLQREESYMGVLIDDLVTKGTEEPYRMMTARAENRLHLRQDNADLRLTKLGYELGLVDEVQYNNYIKRARDIELAKEKLNRTFSKKDINNALNLLGIDTAYEQGMSGAELVKRLKIENNCDLYNVVCALDESFINISKTAFSTALTDLLYAGYLAKAERQMIEQKRLEKLALSKDTDYFAIKGLRKEAQEKLDKIKPLTIGQASRISGVSPADITVLILQNKRGRNGE